MTQTSLLQTLKATIAAARARYDRLPWIVRLAIGWGASYVFRHIIGSELYDVIKAWLANL